MLICWGKQGLGAEAQALAVRLGGEDWGWLHGTSLMGLGCGVGGGLGPPERQGAIAGGV